MSEGTLIEQGRTLARVFMIEKVAADMKTPAEQNGTCSVPAAFNAGQLDRNGRSHAVYTGCCDAARDYHAERRTK